MIALFYVLLGLALAIILGMQRAPLWAWTVAVGTVTALIQTGFAYAPFEWPALNATTVVGWLPTIILGLLCVQPIRRLLLTKPVFKAIRSRFPRVSDTEREALEAGTVGWDAEIFSGTPNWSKLSSVAPIALSPEERAFLDGPTEDLCRMIDDWELRYRQREVPAEIWRFVIEQGFLGMLITKDYGGLGFSPQAQSLIIGKISSRSPDLATIIMVPNSLGPGELLQKYGTDEQKSHYLPLLARGEEIPCFALTGPTSGSDAAAMRDIAVVCEGEYDGQKTLGMRVSWDKRYITLGPIATLLGLAVRLFDPNNLLGRGEDLGITLLLIPTDHPGVEIGRRHLVGGAAFPNGPNWGKDVFVPIDWIIGGRDYAGQGWRMLMSCLAVGRAISLPASSTAAIKAMLRATTAYARIRRQFGIPISQMEGIEEPLARIIDNAYVMEAARSVTASMLGRGEKPAVLSALLKYQSTERMRSSLNDAMDIHGGRAICDGPSNYLQSAYQIMPVTITVEGANILTRTLITFAQGALRSHPWLYREVQAIQDDDPRRGLDMFEKAFGNHVSYTFANMTGAFFHNLTFGQFADAPDQAGNLHKWYRQLARGSRSFACVADLTVALLGGGLKTKQRTAGRLADALSELYLISCVLKRFEDDGEPGKDLPIVEYCLRNGFYRFERALADAVDNFPVPWARWYMRALVFPLGARRRPASDQLGKKVVRQALEPGDVRDRLTRDIYVNDDPNDITGVLEHTLTKVIAAEPAMRKVEKAVRQGVIRRYHTYDWIADAQSNHVITGEEAAQLREVEELSEKVIAVDHFDPAEVIPNFQSPAVQSVAAE